MAGSAANAAIRLVEAAAQHQSLTGEPDRIGRFLDHADRGEVGIFRRAAVTGAAHLGLGEAIELTWVENGFVLHCTDMLLSRSVAALAPDPHGLRTLSGGMASEALDEIILPERSAEVFGKRMRIELRGSRRQVEAFERPIPGQPALR